MINQETIEKINQIQNDFIDKVNGYELQCLFITNIYDRNEGDDYSLSLKREYNEVWSYLEEPFYEHYENFKKIVLDNIPELVNTKWDGRARFFTSLWNSKSDDMFHGLEYADVSLGESYDGGSYYFSLHDYKDHVILFEEDEYGKINITCMDSDGYDSFNDNVNN